VVTSVWIVIGQASHSFAECEVASRPAG
jgi:hypothetical protein